MTNEEAEQDVSGQLHRLSRSEFRIAKSKTKSHGLDFIPSSMIEDAQGNSDQWWS